MNEEGNIKLYRDSCVDNESNQVFECARIEYLKSESRLEEDKEVIYNMLTSKWSHFYDFLKWSRPPRELEEI